MHPNNDAALSNQLLANSEHDASVELIDDDDDDDSNKFTD